MVIPPFSVNMEISKDRNIELCRLLMFIVSVKPN